MTRPDLPEYWHDLIAGYALGDLDSEEAEHLNRLLTEHPELAQELSSYQEALNCLPYALQLTSPPAHLEETILRVTQPQPGATRATAVVPLPRRWRWVGVGGAIAAGLVFWVGNTTQRLQEQVAQNRQLQEQLQDTQQQLAQLQEEVQATRVVISSLREPRSLVYALEGMGPAPNASGYLVAVPGHRQMVLLTQNLPTPPEGKVYRIWAVGEPSLEPMYCGQFNNPSQGKIEWTAPGEGCSASPHRIVITIDALTDTTESGGKPVMGSGI